MSDVKKKLLADIDRKAQRIKEKRVEAASIKTSNLTFSSSLKISRCTPTSKTR